jgi:NADH-ubiquinone oxidoreductase chain 5
MSGIRALYENDLRKIVAFSTLRQLGFIFFCLSIGSYYLRFFHLLIHAIFRSLLFLCSGFFIHRFMGCQDIRFIGGLIIQSPLVRTCFLVSLMRLCGFPFLSGFYSKDFIIELFILMDVNFFFFFFFFFGLILTFFYRFRLIYFLFFGGCYFFRYIRFNDLSKIIISIRILIVFSLFCGSLIFWLFNRDFIYVFDFYNKLITLIFFIFFISVGFLLIFNFTRFNFLSRFFLNM